MLEINHKKLCENCFAQIEKEPCPKCGFDPNRYVKDPMTLALGSILENRYVIGGVIEKGGFGTTYLAYDRKLECRVAVKEYYPYGLAVRSPGTTTVSVSNAEAEETFKNGAEKFYDEARLVAKFNGNPNIVSVHDFFYENDTVYFTMGYLEGQTLKAFLKEHGALSPGQAVCVAEAVSNALMAAHSLNVLHRDISPDNIMVCKDGTIKLLDFGAARQVVTEGSQSLSVILKQGFAPLEQYQKKGKQGPWTDIYSLGATLYHALTLDVLDDPMSRLEEDEEYSSNKHHIADELWQVIKKATALKIQDRYQDIFEWKKDLNNLSIKPVPLVEEPVLGEAGKKGRATVKVLGDTVYSGSGRESAQDESGDAGVQKEDAVGVTVPLQEEDAVGVTMPLREEEAAGTTVPLQGQCRCRKKKWIVWAGVLAAAVVAVFSIVLKNGKGRDTEGAAGKARENVQEEVQIASNVMKEDAWAKKEVYIGSWQHWEENWGENPDVFGNSQLKRTDINRISFLDTKENMPFGAWDVSKAQDGTVMAWVKRNGSHLYIAAEGMITVESARCLFGGYTNLKKIEFNNCFDTSQTTDMSYMFAECTNLESVDVSGFDTGQVTNMSYMFYDCSSLGSLDVSGFNTSQVRTMDWMFEDCSSLTSLDVSGFGTDQVTDMTSMFSGCSSLTSLDVSGFGTDQVTDMTSMFSGCSSLTSLDVSGFDTSQVRMMFCMFEGCSSLTGLDVSGFDTSQVRGQGMQGMFWGCSSLTNLDVSGFDISQVWDEITEDMFDGAGITAEEAGLSQ